MRQHRGQWNRGTWTKKANAAEAFETHLTSKNSPLQNVVKDDSCTWTDTARVEDSGPCWDAHIYDAAFFDDNKKIFEWDDCGALESLTKAEGNLQQGISSVYADYLYDSEHFSAPIDWDTRWSCALPDCAEDVQNRDEKKQDLKGNFARKEQSDGTSVVILGLPEAKDDPGCSGTPSLHLPLDFVPFPTGWDEAEENPIESRGDDSPIQPLVDTSLEKVQLKLSQDRWQTKGCANEVLVTGTGWPEYPSSYQYIIPSGWGDVQADPPVIPSGWGDHTEYPRSDIQMHQTDTEWGEYASKEPNSSVSAWGNFHDSADTCDVVYGNSQSGKQQDFYNNSYKYGYWKPKRGSDTTNYESSGRRSFQRPGRPISTMYRVNHDPRPRLNRLERSKPQWQSAGTLTHGTGPVPVEILLGKQGESIASWGKFEENGR